MPVPNPAFKRIAILCLAFGASMGASGCAHRAPDPGANRVQGRSCREPEELLDVLARFSTAVQARDYDRAVAMLAPEDQARMTTPAGTVLMEMKAKLDALDFKALATDRRIDLVRGRLKGVFDCLPCLDQGPAVTVAKEVPARPAPPEPASPEGLEKARRDMAKEFHRKIQMGRWQEASGLVHPDEWAVFLDTDQALTDLNERRLQAIEECDLDALTLKDGLLTGIVVLLEPPVSELYLKAGEFFDLVESDRIEEALGMLLESEKRFFVDAEGRPRPDRVARLKALEREEWRKLYLYHEVLLGVAEAAIGFGNL